MTHVLDASALLAFLFRERGHEQVASIVDNSCISTVNYSEVLARFARDGHDVEAVDRALARSPMRLVEFRE